MVSISRMRGEPGPQLIACPSRQDAMPLVQTLAAQISSRSRARGRAYFQSGAVRALTVEDGIVHATVRGSTSYDVWLEPERALLRVSCTCPYFVDHLEICKHVWAAILAAEAQAVPLVAPGIAPREVVLDPVHPDEELSEIDVERPGPRRPG